MLPCLPSQSSPRAAVLALCGLLLSAASALAQAAEPAASSGYWQAINQGVAEYGEGRFEQARASFELAQRLWPNARPLRGLGKVAFAQHRFVAAVDYFQRALDSNVHPLDAIMKREVEALRVHAQSALAEVDVELDPAHAEVLINDRPTGLLLGKPLLLDPGDHQLLARSQGYAPERRSYKLRPGERTRWNIRLHREPQLAVSTTPHAVAHTLPTTTPAPQMDSPWLLPTGATLAVAGLATAGVALGLTITHFDFSDKVLGATDEKRATYSQQWDGSRQRMLWVSGVATGLLCLGAGALADYIPRRHRPWLSPTLTAAGSVLLVTGLSVYGANRSAATSDAPVVERVHPIIRTDTGSLLVMLSAPLLTIPLMHAVSWLSGDK